MYKLILFYHIGMSTLFLSLFLIIFVLFIVTLRVFLPDFYMRQQKYDSLAILPIITYDNINDVVSFINDREKPLALYMFSQDKKNINLITNNCYYGGGCINDVVIHLATSNMGFGGVGESGMGAYHGKAGFDTFSHKKSIVDKKTFIDLPMLYQPYNKFG